MRVVYLYLHPNLVKLTGSWHWDASTDAVYCSDVIGPFPEGFEGTRGILHPDDAPAVRAALEAAGAGAFDLAFRLITTHGPVMPLAGKSLSIAEPDPEAAPAPKADWQQELAAREEQRATARLRQRAVAADLAEKQSGIASWYYNVVSHETWYSDNVYRLHGLPPQSLNAHLLTFSGFIHPMDAPVVEDSFDRAYHRHLPLDISYRIHTPDGQERSLRLCTAWLHNDAGQEVLYGLLQDITAQASLEEQISLVTDTARSRYEALRDAEKIGQLGSWQFNVHTGKWGFSDSYYRLLGLQPRSVDPSAALLLQFVHPDDRETVTEACQRMEQEHECPDLDFRVLRKDGQTRYFQQRSRSVLLPSGELLLTGTVRDLTMQRALERRESRAREIAAFREEVLRRAERAGAICTWTWDLQRQKMEWSAGFFELLGYKPNFLELSQKLLTSFLHPDDRKKFNDTVDTVLQLGGDAHLQLRLVVKEQMRFLAAYFEVLHREDGNYFVGVFRDETVQHEQQGLAVAAERLAALLANQLPERMLYTDASHNILRANDAAQKWLQGRGQQTLGQNLFEILPRLKAPGFLERMARAWKGEAGTEPSLVATEAGASHQLLPVRDDAGNVSAVLHLFREGTAAAGIGLQLAERLADAVSERVIVLDRRMNYQVWNSACEKHYGIPREEIIGHNLLEMSPGFIDDPGYQDFKRALRGETVRLGGNNTDECTDGCLVPVIDKAGGVTHLLWVARGGVPH